MTVVRCRGVPGVWYSGVVQYGYQSRYTTKPIRIALRVLILRLNYTNLSVFDHADLDHADLDHADLDHADLDPTND